jgi:predicted aspartyl protease
VRFGAGFQLELQGKWPQAQAAAKPKPKPMAERKQKPAGLTCQAQGQGHFNCGYSLSFLVTHIPATYYFIIHKKMNNE